MPEQQVDRRLVDQTRRDIQRLVEEIEEFAAREISPPEFFAEVGLRVDQALAARAVAIWLTTPQGNLQLSYQTKLEAAHLDADPFTKSAHDALLRYVFERGDARVFSPHSGTGEAFGDATLTNPTDFLIIAHPIELDGKTIGLIETFMDGGRQPAAHAGYIKLLRRACGETGKFLRNFQYRNVRRQQEQFDAVEQYIRTVHGGLHPKQVCYQIANDGKKLVGAERVSVALRQGKKTRIEAISGQDVVDKKSNLVRLMARAADRTLKHQENLVYKGAIEEHWPTDLKKALTAYLEESETKVFAAVPLEDTREFGRKGKVDGLLIVEMIEDDQEPDDMGARIEVVTRHGSAALYNALEHQRIFAMPVFRAMGDSTQWLTASRMPKVIIGLVLAGILLLSMFVVPWPLRMEARGEITPAVRRQIFAPVAGVIEEVAVDHNDQVEEGSLLAALKSTTLEDERRQANSALTVATQEKLNAVRLEQGTRDFDEKAQYKARVAQKDREIRGYEEQLKLIREQIQDLRLESPIHGHVMTENTAETLLSRPVSQGDPLLEIADTDGRWWLEVAFPENTVTHVSRAMREAEEAGLEGVPCTFIVSSTPDRIYNGTLIEMNTTAQSIDGENVVEAKIAIDPDDFPKIEKRKGLEVRVKADCGPAPVGYVLFRELIDFVRGYVFF